MVGCRGHRPCTANDKVSSAQPASIEMRGIGDGSDENFVSVRPRMVDIGTHYFALTNESTESAQRLEISIITLGAGRLCPNVRIA
jgi:hypothetical protein